MDDAVIRAMARWPNVPAVYGWLALDRRGAWRLRGDPVLHRGAVEFINRNYAGNAAGQWYFQNGPQRAFVDLEYTPWVYVLDGAGALATHTGAPAGAIEGAWMDEEGQLLLETAHGVGLVCDRDLDRVSEHLCRADGTPCRDTDVEALIGAAAGTAHADVQLDWDGCRVPVRAIRRREVPARFGFDPRPRADDTRET
ncbi:MAG: DUF2946 family protein [Gammaproteobacteria bacterium]|nr:DUF2946 family protein [Gammaproteobacteria bacterium]